MRGTVAKMLRREAAGKRVIGQRIMTTYEQLKRRWNRLTTYEQLKRRWNRLSHKQRGEASRLFNK